MARDINNPLSESVFDNDNANVNQSRPPTRVSKDNSGLVMRGNWGGDTGLYRPQKGSEFNKAIRVSDVDSINEQAWKTAMRTAKGQGGKRVKNKDGTTTWVPGPYHTGEVVPYSYEKIVKGDDGKWTRQTVNSRMRKAGGQKITQIPKKKLPVLRDDKGNVVTRVGEDGIKRAVRGIQNTQTNEPIRSIKRKGGEVRTNKGTSNTAPTNKSNTTKTTPSEVKTSKGRTSSTASSNKGTTYTERTGKQTQRGTGKTYEDVWNNATPEYKKRFGGDKQKAIQAMKDWNAKQDAKKAKKTTTTKKKNASANTVSETEKKKLTSRSMFDKIPVGRKI